MSVWGQLAWHRVEWFREELTYMQKGHIEAEKIVSFKTCALDNQTSAKQAQCP